MAHTNSEIIGFIMDTARAFSCCSMYNTPSGPRFSMDGDVLNGTDWTDPRSIAHAVEVKANAFDKTEHLKRRLDAGLNADDAINAMAEAEREVKNFAVRVNELVRLADK